MDTPFKSDGFRKRKLKKIMKKKQVNLHSSLSSSSYQKKVKAAINVSLNSTRNVRTLQTNNRSLANGLEKWKQECRSAQDKCNYLLQVNHDLREHILQLERKLLASPSFIKEEIEKQCKLRMNKIENDIKGLFSCAQGFIEHILRVMKSYTEEPPEEPSLSNLSLPSSLHLSTSQHIDEEFDEEVGPIYKRTHAKDLSMITEQSLCLLPGEEFSMDIIAEDQVTQKPPEKLLSKLPLRIPVKSKDQSLRKTDLEKNIEIIHSVSPEKPFSKSSPTSKRSPAIGTGLKSPTSSAVNKENLTSMKGKSDLQDSQQTACINSRSPKSQKKTGAKKTQKLILSKASPKKDTPLITNEFTLVNSFLEMTKKRHMLEQKEKNECQLKSPSADGDRTNLCVVDMELTSIDTMPLVSSTGDSTKSDTVDVALVSNTQSADDCNVTEAPIIDELVWADQKFPDAVTLRRGKPGQFNFAASRKESDGTRKSLPVTAPAKSRSRKKKISDKSALVPGSSPKNIFDFHEKTPKGLNETRSRDVTIFNITGDVTTSPLPPLSKFRQNKTKDGKAESMSQQGACSVTSPDKFFSMLSDEPEYQLPLKGSPNKKKISPKSTRRSRSQSRSKKLQGESKDNKVRAQSEGRRSNLLVTTPVKDPQSVSKRVRSKGKVDKKNSPASGDKEVRSRRKTFVLSKVKGTGDCKNEIESDRASPIQQLTKMSVQQRRTQRVSFMNIPGQSPQIDETFSLLSTLDKTEEATLEKSKKDDEHLNNIEQVAPVEKTPTISVGIQKGKAVVKIMKEKEQHVTCSKEQLIASSEPRNNNNASESSQNNEEDNKNRGSFENATSRWLTKLKHLKTPKLSVNEENVSMSEGSKVSNKNSSAAKKKKSKTDKSPVNDKKASIHKNLSEKASAKYATPSTAEQSSPQTRTKSPSAKLISKKTLADIDPNTCKLPEEKITNKSPNLKRGLEIQSTGEQSSPQTRNRTKSPSAKMISKKTLADIDPNTCKLPEEKITNKSPNLKRGLEIQSLSSDVPELKKRRAANKVQSYVEPSVKTKLRRGDPISSHYCTSENIPIFKEKIRDKVKKVPVSKLEPVHNQSIQEEN